MRDEVLDRTGWFTLLLSLCLFTLALADIGSNSGSSKSKRTLSRKEEIKLTGSPVGPLTYLTILLKVSASVSPMNGENPERRMYVMTPTAL